jgi:D-aspartate ligase
MTANRPPAVVLCDGSNGLGVVRSLARRRVPTIAVAMDKRQIALLSRYPARKLWVADSSDRGLLEFLMNLPNAGAVLVPTADRHVHLISANRQLLSECYRFCIPPDETTAALLDKRREIKLMQSIGIPIPNSMAELPQEPDQLERSLGYPLLIKPRSYVFRGVLQTKTLSIRNRKELDRFYSTCAGSLDALVAQEVVPGAEDNLWKCDCTFDWHSDLIAAFTFRKLRTMPSHFGVASLAVSESNPAVSTIARRLGKALSYTGPANVEFKFDQRDGQYKYVEINPRLGMCNYFDTVCGVHNSWYAYLLALGETPPLPDGKQQDGVIYTAFLMDIYCRLHDHESPGKIARHYLKLCDRRRVGAFFSWSDPAPGVVDTWRTLKWWAGGAVRKASKRLQWQSNA